MGVKVSSLINIISDSVRVTSISIDVDIFNTIVSTSIGVSICTNISVSSSISIGISVNVIVASISIKIGVNRLSISAYTGISILVSASVRTCTYKSTDNGFIGFDSIVYVIYYSVNSIHTSFSIPESEHLPDLDDPIVPDLTLILVVAMVVVATGFAESAIRPLSAEPVSSAVSAISAEVLTALDVMCHTTVPGLTITTVTV
jgi:hypothetical protein